MTHHNFSTFKHFHHSKQPLVLINSWDAASSVVLQNLGASAIATSSASLAWANGFADGSNLPLNLLLASIEQILRVINIPLTVDIEAGYSDSPAEVANLVTRLAAMGVCGINIEDGNQSPDLLAEKITAIKSTSAGKKIFINARTDVFLRELVGANNVLSESAMRLKKYAQAGADGGFVPGVASAQVVKEMVQQLDLPINVMLAAVDLDIQPFIDAGVARISYGPAPFLAAYNHFSDISTKILGLPDKAQITYASINQAMG